MQRKYCEICGKRPAELEYVEIVNGVKRIMHLCRICAEKEANGLKLFLTDDVKEESTMACPVCGTPLSYIESSLKLGCPACYNTFEGVIKDLLKKLQGSVTFSGEKDLKSSEEKDLIVMKHRLKKELEKAVENEEFEKAAKLRDEIDNINKRLKWLGMSHTE